jgi:hypothetical protein
MASMLNKLDEALSLRDSIKSCNNNMHQIESRLGSKVSEVKGKLDETKQMVGSIENIFQSFSKETNIIK